MGTILPFLDVRRSTIFQFMVDWLIYDACRAGEQKRGLPPQQWWWEKKMRLKQKELMNNETLFGPSDNIHMDPPKRQQRFYRECGENT
jgi:hypothetical protein